MGAAAALIPGIVGIAGGEYAGYKKRQSEEEMQRRQAASLGRFLDPNLEMQPVRNSMGIGAPNIEQRQSLAPDMMGGDATRRAIQARTPDARLNRFAFEQYLAGNKAIANKLIEQRLVPGQTEYINIMNTKTYEISSFPKNQPIPPGFAIAGNAEPPKPDKPSDFQLGFADWQKLHPGGTILQYKAEEAAATRAPTAPLSTFDDESKLRSEFDRKTQDFTIVRDAYSNISIVASDASPAGDLSLIFSYMKLLDPTSSVKEGEYATAQNAASVPETVRAKFNKALKGETLTPSQRADFVKQSGNIYESKRKSFESESLRYTDLAKQYKLDPNKIVYDRTNGIVKVIAKIPPVGFEQNGYIFIGVDPSKETDWIPK